MDGEPALPEPDFSAGVELLQSPSPLLRPADRVTNHPTKSSTALPLSDYLMPLCLSFLGSQLGRRAIACLPHSVTTGSGLPGPKQYLSLGFQWALPIDGKCFLIAFCLKAFLSRRHFCLDTHLSLEGGGVYYVFPLLSLTCICPQTHPCGPVSVSWS